MQRTLLGRTWVGREMDGGENAGCLIILFDWALLHRFSLASKKLV